jgi:Zn-dependent protease with chaperone function
MVLAALLGLATILLTIRIDAITGQQWDRLVQTRELEADAFAARFTGSPEAVRVMLQQCVDLEDDGVTGTALSARMTILQAAYGAASTGKSGV